MAFFIVFIIDFFIIIELYHGQFGILADVKYYLILKNG